jgi:agmatinase
VDAASPAELARRISAITQDRKCYVTVDIDCLDPAYAPGTGTPVAGGMTTLKLLQTLRRVSTLPVVGFDVVEVCPPYDTGGITALAAATVVYEQVCRLAVQAGAVPRAYPSPSAPAFQAPAGPLCQAHEILSS